jgi:hypothetical protein
MFYKTSSKIYIAHGSHFERHIFSNNMLQTDLKYDIRLMRTRIIFYSNHGKILSACKAIGGIVGLGTF